MSLAAPLYLRLERDPRLGAVVVVGGCGALAARGWLFGNLDNAVPIVVALFVLIGVVGALWPLPLRRPAVATRQSVVALALGLAAFGLGRLLLGGSRPAEPLDLVAVAVALNVLAAVAEEAFFRRLLYGLLEHRGTALAIWGSAAAFALVHVTVWGWWVVPLDFVAGLLLGWQRAASGTWVVPAITHAVANVWALS